MEHTKFSEHFDILTWIPNIHILHEGHKDYKCEICEKSFTESKTLQNHIKIKHTGLLEHQCDICKKSYCTKGELNRHVKNVHGKKQMKQE